jgi:hypothetical protein
MTAMGWKLEDIEEMPFADIVQLFEYWAEYPPLHLMVRTYMGYKSVPKEDQPKEKPHIVAPKLANAPKQVRDVFEELKGSATSDGKPQRR